VDTRTDLALWGCGGMGRSLVEALENVEGTRLIATYDLDPDASRAIADRYDAIPAQSPNDLLNRPDLDGVIVAVPQYAHAQATILAARAGVHVFVEKPMALCVADCQTMIDAAAQHGIKLMVGHVLRYYEPYRSILRWSREQRFGRILAASIWRTTDGSRWDVDGYWRASRAKSGGFLMEVGAHELDMLRCLMGKPQAVHAVLQKALPYCHEMEDLISVQIQFVGGGIAHYEGGGGSYKPGYGFRLYFENATLLSDAAFDRAALRIYGPGGTAIDVPEPGFSAEHPVTAELADWVAAIRGERDVPVPGKEGLATVALALAAYRSAETRQIVPYEIA